MDDIPEVSKKTALDSTVWKPTDNVLRKIIYVDHVTSYEDFFRNILLKNQLCVIGPQATANWASRNNWVMTDGSPNFRYLLDNFGDSLAPVADCDSEEFCSHPKTEMTVKEYLAYWQSLRMHDDSQHKKCLYLKDWHFTRDFPGYSEYQAPVFMCSDWMNEFWDVWQDKGKTDDYRFVYMGPAGSWTPFHADVLHSYSWSANICGRKKWIFFPPGTEKCLRDKHGQLTFDLRSPDLQDAQRYPEGSSAADVAVTVIQNPGEIIFVPSGWHHEVFNLENTISINHNWLNGCSVHLTWEYLKSRLLAVQKEIDDCRDMEGWHQHCQVMLKADSGIDFTDFYNFIVCIATHRMKTLDRYVKTRISMDQLSISYSVTQTESSENARHDHDDKNNDDDRNNDKHEYEIIYNDYAEAERSQECSQIHTDDRCTKQVSTLKDEKLISSTNTYNHDIQETKSVYNNIHIHHFNSELLNNSKTKSDNLLRSTSENNNNREVFSYLCLYKGTVVNTGNFLRHDSGFADSAGEYFNEEHEADHKNCPHWAHMGPHLALFDLCRVLDIVQDMQMCEEFKIIMKDLSYDRRMSIAPSELISQVNDIVMQMRQELPVTK